MWHKVFPDSKLHKFERKASSYGKKNYWKLECHCRYTLEFLRNIGILAVKSDKKIIPSSVLQSPKEVASEFLKSYFEGDGSISYSNKMIELSCCSKSSKLIEELQVLLLRFGIETFRRFDKYKNINKLFIRNKRNILRFYKEINFAFEGKRKKLEFVLVNYKKEEGRRMEDIARFVISGAISDILPVLDSFDLAFKIRQLADDKSQEQGVLMIKTQLLDVLRRRGLEIIQLKPGEDFNPERHESVGEVESEYPAGAVAEEVQKGYLLRDKVLRPVRVRLAKGKQI